MVFEVGGSREKFMLSADPRQPAAAAAMNVEIVSVADLSDPSQPRLAIKSSRYP